MTALDCLEAIQGL